MGVPIEIALPGQAKVDALAVPLAQPLGDLAGDGARIVDEKLGGRLRQLAASGELRGERGEAVVLHTNGDLEAPRVVAVGLGKRGEVDADALRTAAAAAAQALGRVGGTLCWLLDESLPLPVAAQASALVEGTILGGYTPGRWKTQEPDLRPRPIERIVLGHFESEELRQAAERASLVAERTNRARDLANMPPNELNPHTLAEHAQQLASEHEHLKAEVLGPRELDKLEMGALSALGRGSRNEPRLSGGRRRRGPSGGGGGRRRGGAWPGGRPPRPERARPGRLLGLVGKAITFDAGGISLKSANRMEAMKGDMAGGAGTLHGIGA